MARCGIFQGLRQRRRAFGAFLAYVLLINALLATAFSVQAVAAALDPLAAATTCDSTGSGSHQDPIRHNGSHQPDCTLCSPACPMAAPAQGLACPIALLPALPASFDRGAYPHRTSAVNPQSVYRSDASAQAPPAIA